MGNILKGFIAAFDRLFAPPEHIGRISDEALEILEDRDASSELESLLQSGEEGNVEVKGKKFHITREVAHEPGRAELAH